jgi:folate-binding protein YgfZ
MTASPFLALPGAVAADGRAVAAHYGSPLREQRLLTEHDAIVDLSDHGVVTVTGPDRLTWLNSMGSQLVSGLRPGESSELLLLDPNGHIEHAPRVIDDGESVWMLVEGPETTPLIEFLVSMRFMLRVEIADRTGEYATIGTFGDPKRLGGVTTWRDPWAHVMTGGHQYAATTRHPGETWTWSETVVSRDRLAELSARAASGELQAAGVLALDALRIAAWRPRFATEVDDRTIPHELDWLRTAVHLNKGCYRGQETIAKVHNLGHPPRRLVMLNLDGSEGVLPAPGAEVFAERRGEQAVVGRVTSAAIHYELGPIALAVIKRTVAAESVVQVDADGTRVPATQEIIVPPEAGATANVPRLPRLGAVSR